MLRWSLLLVGLALSSCVLGDGIDLPSTHVEPGMDIDAGSDSGSDGLVEGSTDSPPVLTPDAPVTPSGTGGMGCCEHCCDPNLGGASGAVSEEAP